MKTVLITGASSGIGKALAERFAKEGAHLILVAKDSTKLEDTANQLKQGYTCSIITIAQDLSQADAAQAIYSIIDEQGLIPDTVINNAGFGDHSDFMNCDLDKQIRMIAVNNAALVAISRLFLPLLKNQGQDTFLINICSTAAFQPGPYMAVYHATKSFVLSFSLALSEELKDSKVQVKAICPGPTRTGFEAYAGPGSQKLFATFKNSSAERIADFTYRELKRDRVVAIPGFRNRFFAVLAKISPASLTTRAVGRIMKSPYQKGDKHGND
ncbi:SDR family NAD(P)-dependent oxidoreductase [Streptococcus chenjunshii]|uniref:SDR family NAD(P)-dependent oxidoreductase n=1 Tax=Streptococcus chenjunshii TaxID=2173853 RepID=UPI0013C3110B|nr:SDR family oxidoreductase [Streptococcus chenjunshii]